MPHPHAPCTAVLGMLVLLGGGLVACDRNQIEGPKAEVQKNEMKLSLPAVPAFDLPAAPADGSHTVKEMRVKGKKLLETDVTVKGIVTWVYDCPTALRQPSMSEKDVKDLQKSIEEDPSKCERPKFYIGDAADTPPEKSMWVVEVPRPFYKIELERAPKEDLRNPPPDRCDAKADPKKSTCPRYKVGDEVEVTGTWKLTSPHTERNSDGLLVYKRMKNITQSWESPVIEPRPGAQGTPSAPTRPSPQDLVRQSGKSSG